MYTFKLVTTIAIDITLKQFFKEILSLANSGEFKMNVIFVLLVKPSSILRLK